MSQRIALRSSKVVTPDGVRAAIVVIEAGLIVDVLDAAAELPGVEIEDLGDDALLPGLVDSHVHVNEPGRTDWEGWATASRAGVLGPSAPQPSLPVPGGYQGLLPPQRPTQARRISLALTSPLPQLLMDRRESSCLSSGLKGREAAPEKGTPEAQLGDGLRPGDWWQVDCRRSQAGFVTPSPGRTPSVCLTPTRSRSTA